MSNGKILALILLLVLLGLDFLVLMLYHDPVLSVFSLIFTLIGAGFGAVFVQSDGQAHSRPGE